MGKKPFFPFKGQFLTQIPSLTEVDPLIGGLIYAQIYFGFRQVCGGSPKRGGIIPKSSGNRRNGYSGNNRGGCTWSFTPLFLTGYRNLNGFGRNSI